MNARSACLQASDPRQQVSSAAFCSFRSLADFPLRPVYLSIGIIGAIFTLSLLTLPRQPWTFGVAITGENLFQALAFATANAIAFEVIGPDNPFAATLFTVLLAASNLPITYMQYVDGIGYNWRGITGILHYRRCHQHFRSAFVLALGNHALAIQFQARPRHPLSPDR